MKIKKYDIEITKPWSKEMYAHNDEVLREVVEEVRDRWSSTFDPDREGSGLCPQGG